MNEERLQAMQRRMIRNMTTLGISMIAAGPIAWFFAPLGFALGPAFVVFGILSVVRASQLRSNITSSRR